MLAGGIALVLAGGWVFTAGVAVILSLAGWEYGRMFQSGGFHPSIPILVGGIGILAFTSGSASFNDETFLFTFCLASLLGIIYHIFLFSKHKETGGIDLAATLSGLVLVGLFGSFILRLRFLPDGLFWLILAILPAGISDVGAYFVGCLLGKHKLAPDLSPKKTIEGYFGGVFTSALTGYIAGAVSSIFNPAFNGLTGLLIGLVIGFLCPLGDLGKSLIKRQFNLKNTSNLIPGHGGVLDRLDTCLWAGVLGYYLITIFFIK